ncbi:MAG: hypothetical protein GOVbin1709_63 [Prokaryotic dsDNA virus sp.]|nr:MAG: hypothetical protein GOVbin1709_63 [Prokaryotic dsDNA virus sp.]|tara:strand:+ start:11686 stop:11922 length:237 start_codon:yes stop_codon:yes gene_type:complete
MIQQLKKLANQKKEKIKRIFFRGKLWNIYKATKTKEIFFEEEHDHKIHLKEKQFITAEQAEQMHETWAEWEAEIKKGK